MSTPQAAAVGAVTARLRFDRYSGDIELLPTPGARRHAHHVAHALRALGELLLLSPLAAGSMGAGLAIAPDEAP